NDDNSNIINYPTIEEEVPEENETVVLEPSAPPLPPPETEKMTDVILNPVIIHRPKPKIPDPPLPYTQKLFFDPFQEKWVPSTGLSEDAKNEENYGLGLELKYNLDDNLPESFDNKIAIIKYEYDK